jgi:hypothetical protein
MQAVDDAQREPIPQKGRFMPHILFHTRLADKDQQIDKSSSKRNIASVTRTSSPKSLSKRLNRSASLVGSAIDEIQKMSLANMMRNTARDKADMPTRQIVNDLISSFPNLSRTELLDMLINGMTRGNQLRQAFCIRNQLQLLRAHGPSHTTFIWVNAFYYSLNDKLWE